MFAKMKTECDYLIKFLALSTFDFKEDTLSKDFSTGICTTIGKKNFIVKNLVEKLHDNK